ncbi:hypothetical protein HCN51_24000 [Nonomuraea sp. FMUSA5-5]|uniref:Uncharacterized protein n=1 Tax=Nonomuraea composti TaxID=2720023 RepID=A0ABX1BB22_9ACTN|nr:hypothetical protein [Nonomuraea sp. FMUSA5-5]NJP92496.1 hypothetical protein [Nonomuraea sp. FMUSA5-5]
MLDLTWVLAEEWTALRTVIGRPDLGDVELDRPGIVHQACPPVLVQVEARTAGEDALRQHQHVGVAQVGLRLQYHGPGAVLEADRGLGASRLSSAVSARPKLGSCASEAVTVRRSARSWSAARAPGMR